MNTCAITPGFSSLCFSLRNLLSLWISDSWIQGSFYMAMWFLLFFFLLHFLTLLFKKRSHGEKNQRDYLSLLMLGLQEIHFFFFACAILLLEIVLPNPFLPSISHQKPRLECENDQDDRWGLGNSIDAESKAKLPKQNTKLGIIVLTFIYQELE